jgi:ferritin-like protein
MASEGFHEPIDALEQATLERHRAISSLMEEFEAVDWYDQRVDATTDADLRRVLVHNRDEEKEHAAMTLEWLRRRDPALDEQLREWLFTDKTLGVDEEGDGVEPDTASGREPLAGEWAPAAGAEPGTLGVGSLYGKGTL